MESKKFNKTNIFVVVFMHKKHDFVCIVMDHV